MSVDDSYTYPGSGGVLINRLGIQDASTLDQVLNTYVTLRVTELHAESVPEPDFEYLRSIHRRYFGDVFTWAGELRTTDVQAMGTGVPYCRPAFIRPEVERLFAVFHAEDYLLGLPIDDFAARLAERWGDLTAIHPFRDGNTRSQSAWVTSVAWRAGYRLDWRGIDVPVLRELRLHAVVGSSEPLAAYLREHLSGVARRD